MIIHEQFLEIKPMPAPRPRLSLSGNAYYPHEYTKYKEDIALMVRAQYRPVVFTNHYAVEIQFRMATSKYTSKNAGDVDNLAKGILDALTGVIWQDDAKITQLIVSKLPALKYGIFLHVEGFE